MTLYINQGEITGHRFDSESGVMRCTCVARSAGVLKYRRPDGSEWREFVSPELQRAVDSETGMPLVAGLAGLPVTREHPVSLLRGDSDAIAKHKVGETRNKVHVYSDGKVEVTFDVFDAQTQEEIRSGRKTGVSVGYECGSKVESGVWNGERYDALQTLPLKWDHIAVCANPRNPEATITRFDSCGDDVAVQISDTPLNRYDADDKQQLYQIEVGGRPFMVPLDLYLAIKAELGDNDDDYYEDEGSDMKHSNIFDSDEDLKVLMDAKAKAKKMAKEEEEAEDMEDDEEEEEEEEEADSEDRADADTIWMSDRIDSLESELIALRARCAAQDKLLRKFDSIDLDELVRDRVDSILTTYNQLRPYLPEGFQLSGSATVARMKLDAIKEMDAEADVNEDTEEAVLDSLLSVLTRYHHKDSLENQKRILNTPEPKADAKGGWEGLKPKAGMKPLTYGKSSKK
ncbi:MAG: DUF2213 domain-containing protein [Leptodesmis sp.]|uniref:DUF2213 domain-containing protein n=1 Tax=Leptodesmis sp. TaxID=3100501 RepID=UPI003D13B129